MNSVVTNMLAINAGNQLNINNKNWKKSTEKLSSGYKVNRAADDAAGLSISEKMRNQIRNLSQASNNIQDGISLIQTADGAMAEIDNILHRATELCVQAANDTLAAEDRDSIQLELNEILLEIDDISEKTQFNNRYLLKGENALTVGELEPPIISGGMPAWASIDSASAAAGYMSSIHTTSDGISHAASFIDMSGFTPDQIAASEGTGFYTTCCTCKAHYSFKFNSDATSNMEVSGMHYIFNIGIGNATTTDDVINSILDATNSNPNNHYTRLAMDSGRLIIYDERPISEASANSEYGLMGAGIAVSAAPDGVHVGDLYLQTGANSGEDFLMRLPAMSTAMIGVYNLRVNSHEAASDSLERCQNGLLYVNAERSRMGAYQNRLEYTSANVNYYQQNLSDAESSIRDTDMATEIMNNTKQNILMQAAQAMLSQANDQPQSVLSLLQ